MPYSSIPYYPPDEKILTQAQIDANFKKLMQQQADTLKRALGTPLHTYLQLLTEEKHTRGKIQEDV